MPEGADSFLDEWEGVTREEIIEDDEKRWPPVYARIKGDRPGVGWQDARKATEALGVSITPEAMQAHWRDKSHKLFGKTGDADAILLNEAQTYQLFISSGFCATQFIQQKPAPREEFFKLYWNSIRMGGRNPADVGRAIGLEDALSALDLSSSLVDEKEKQELEAFEGLYALKLPATLKALWSRKGALHAIYKGHCNNPNPCSAADFTDPFDTSEIAGKRYAVLIMLPHQGEHAWWVVFNDGDEDGEIWLSIQEESGPAHRVAASLPFFFWDLRETGRHWEQRQKDGS